MRPAAARTAMARVAGARVAGARAAWRLAALDDFAPPAAISGQNVPNAEGPI